MQSDSNQQTPKRGVRSFVLRTGRMTASQKSAFELHWGQYGLELKSGKLNQQAVFGRQAPLVVEIGFGMGESLLAMAQQEPEKCFIGIEVHTPGVGRLLNNISANDVNNIRIYRDDALAVLQQCIVDQSIDRLQLYFPDPWPKKKHHKRRIVQAPFIELVAEKIRGDGVFHMATDWQPYAEHMLEVMEAEGSAYFANMVGSQSFSARPEFRPITKFEKRGTRLGHGVWDLLYSKRQRASSQ